ncbi:HAD family hydrolase [Seonamhaeicola aphaedonensis]|uniref:Phosphoserine phosphatase n=1 Tax=Seonamhaeicola aphaedonensis TaxID=1461338 RepID=A0A3D9HHH9_9FLAO|nr:HAD family hydrolase [Seonamhaeicola aphaedonensis]RED48416.1 phosphoserine phosphatase [Seonamhaeicola aphaedonensis]
MKKSVLVVDLDGTLFSINTFHYFIKFLFQDSIKKRKLFFVLKLSFILLLRLLKVFTHAKMKYSILKMVSKTNIDFIEFVKLIEAKKNDISVLKDFFNIKILATGAPNLYANIIAKNEGFDVCLATNFPRTGFDQKFENIKEVKKNTVMNYLSGESIQEIDIFVTDHIDDLPLMKNAKRNILVAPNQETKSFLEQNKISFEVLK